MTDEDEALCELLERVEGRTTHYYRNPDGPDAARRIRELSAEKDEIQRKLTSMCMDELARLGQEMDLLGSAAERFSVPTGNDQKQEMNDGK